MKKLIIVFIITIIATQSEKSITQTLIDFLRSSSVELQVTFDIDFMSNISGGISQRIIPGRFMNFGMTKFI